MAALKCDICGGGLVAKAGGLFECEYCGMQYDKSRIQEMVQEIKGTVKVEGTVEVKGTVKLDGPVEVKGKANVESLLKRAQLALEDREGERAEEYFEKVLTINPKCAEAYFGLAMLGAGVTSLEKLVWENKWENKNYRRGKQFADPALRSKIQRLEQEFIAHLSDLKTRQSKLRALSTLFSAGNGYTVALNTDGSVVAVGDNRYKQCDVNEWKYLTDEVVAVSAGTTAAALLEDGSVVVAGNEKYSNIAWKNISAISAGNSMVVGLKTDGTVMYAGNNSKIPDVSDWKNITAISAAYAHIAGLKSDGTVVAVGDNSRDQCDVGGWKDIIAISAGGTLTLGLKADGTVESTISPLHWDYRSTINSWRDIIAISAGRSVGGHAVGLKADGTVVAAGSNAHGECDVDDWTDIVAISAGNYHTVGLKSDGTLVTVGENDKGQCNVGSWKLFQSIDSIEQERAAARPDRKTRAVEYQLECQQEQLRREKKAAEELLAQKQRMKTARERIKKAKNMLSIGYDHIVGVNENGAVVTAGGNYLGQCDVFGWRKIVAVAAGHHFTAGLRANGSVVTVGASINGQNEVFGWSNIVSIAVSERQTIGLRKNGTVVAAGGKGDRENGPFKVSEWRDIVAIAADRFYAYGLKDDGTVLIADGNSSRIKYQDQEIVEIAAGFHGFVALRSDGTVMCTSSKEAEVKKWRDIIAIAACGDGILGLKADGTVVFASDYHGKYDVSGWKDIVAIAAGDKNIAGLTRNGTVVIADYLEDRDKVTGWKLFHHFDSLRPTAQRAWRFIGVCQHCGGELKGFFGKNCVSCGRSKDY